MQNIYISNQSVFIWLVKICTLKASSALFYQIQSAKQQCKIHNYQPSLALRSLVIRITMCFVSQQLPIKSAVVVVCIQSHSAYYPLSEVRVGYVQLSKRYSVTIFLLQFSESALSIESVVSKDETAEVGSECFADVRHLLFARNMQIEAFSLLLLFRLNQLYETYLSGAEFFEQIAVGLSGVQVRYIVVSAHRREFCSDLVRFQMFQCDFDELQYESASIFGISAIAVSPAVGMRPQKLINQKSSYPIDLDSIKSCTFCINYTLLELSLRGFYIFNSHFFGHWEVFPTQKVTFLGSYANCRWCPRLKSSVDGG